MTMYRVPVFDYLDLVRGVTRSDFKLQHQRVLDGFVLFETDAEISRIKLLTDAHNNDDALPFMDAKGDNIVWENRESLRNIRRSGGEGWYSAQCPACAEGGQDRNMNNLQLSAMGFKCVRGCTGKDVITATKALVEPPVEVGEIHPGQMVLDLSEAKPEGMDGARLVQQTQKKERYTKVEEVDGKTILTVYRKTRNTGEIKEESHPIDSKATRRLWVWLQRFPQGATIRSEQIRAYLAPFYGLSSDVWASHAHRSEYFEAHYYPLLWLEYKRAITYNHDGSVVRIADEVQP